jgi:hypothetical protein
MTASWTLGSKIRQKTFVAEHFGELIPGSLHALADVSPGFERAVEVVQYGKKLLNQPLGSHGENTEAFPLLTLARVLELSLQTLQGLEVLVPIPARGLELHGEHRRLIPL